MFRIRLLSAFLVLMASASALAEMKFAIGEPAEDSTESGIGQISGWAVSDIPITSVEAFIDGVSLGLVPYGGTRMDVADVFPDYPDSEHSGWAMKWNYSLLAEGEHLVTVVVTDEEGNQQSKDVVFQTTAFTQDFIPDPAMVQTSNAVITSPEDGLIVITGALVDDEIVDIELTWDTASQQFQITKITGEEPVIENQAPTADAGPSFDVNMGESVVVEGSGHDPDGSVESYSWSQVSGLPVDLVDANNRIVQFTAPEQTGSVKLRLTVTDDSGASDQDDTTIEIVETVPENQAPTAGAGPNLTVETGEMVEITGSASDTDGTIDSWNWARTSGLSVTLQNANTPTVSFTAPDSAGTIQLSLTVTDDDGATDSDNVTITVEDSAPPPNQAPNANAGPNLTVETGEVVEITGSASDSDGTIDAWNWARISGLSVTLQNANTPTVRFTAPNGEGTIQLRLTVTDDDGATDSDNVTITVEDPAPPPNQSPTANAGPNRSVEQGENVTVEGNGSDPDGTIASWSWTQVSGPSVSLTNANSQDVQFTAPNSAGEIRLRLTVTDNDGATDSDTVIITVEEVSNTTGETLQSMMSAINAARGQPQTCGSDNFPAQPPLQWSSSLANIAKIHSMDMATQGYFSHTSADGTSMGSRVFPYWSGSRVGENIAASSVNRSNSYVVNLWMNSPGHCALIMDPDFTHAGVGAGHNPDNGYTYHHFWTLDFGG